MPATPLHPFRRGQHNLQPGIVVGVFGLSVHGFNGYSGKPGDGYTLGLLQVGWDFGYLNHLYRNLVDVERIRTEEQLHKFVAAVARKESPSLIGNVENHRERWPGIGQWLRSLMEG